MSCSVAVDIQACKVCVIVCPIVIKIGTWTNFSRTPKVKVSKEGMQQALSFYTQADIQLNKEDHFPI